MKKTIFTIFQYLFFLALGLLFAWLTLKDITPEQWQNIKSSIAHARQWVIVPVILMLLLSHLSRAIRWKILMEPLGYKPSTFNTFAAVMIGYLVNSGVPRLGELVKCTMLARYEKVRPDKLIGTIFVERAIDFVCLVIVFILALLFQGDVIGAYTAQFLKTLFQDNTGNVSLIKLSAWIIGIVGFLLLVYFLLKRFGHIDAVGRVKKVVIHIWFGLNSIRYIRHKGFFLLHTFFIWCLYLLSTTAGIYALHETESLGIGAGLTTLAVGSVGMIVTPGGIGAYAWLVEKLMGLYHVHPETGKALGWLLWSAQTIIVVLGGLICFGLLSYFNKKTTPLAKT